ncbi:uncharacterized protein LOC114742987 isoform X2 [Neltuma alba]|uniref:uncharacterized protein LOC114742987 isoform X2 n=1 Tax=Neltuma alba TaxID=207710 RepID=UPI0010A3C903|nr:uncharacterized protein LOC114742987 isoform X2 [Prosopis alba]
MRIRKSQLFFPFSSLSPAPLSDPHLINPSPVVQLDDDIVLPPKPSPPSTLSDHPRPSDQLLLRSAGLPTSPMIPPASQPWPRIVELTVSPKNNMVWRKMGEVQERKERRVMIPGKGAYRVRKQSLITSSHPQVLLIKMRDGARERERFH